MKRLALILALASTTACHAAPAKPAAATQATVQKNWTVADVEKKIADIIAERDDFAKKAQQQMVAYEGAIAGLKALIAPPPAPAKK